MGELSRLEEAVTPFIQRAQGGDPAAFREVVRLCHATVYRWALVHTGDGDEAEDVAQEALIRVHAGLKRFAGRSRFTTWLYQVTRNTALEAGRRLAARTRALRRSQAVADVRAAPADPLDRIHAADIAVLVRAFLGELPPGQREAFALVELEGLDPGEVAARLGVRTVTVRTHLFRARRALRRRLLERHPMREEGTGT